MTNAQLLRQPLSDRLVALGIAVSMHVALGYALLLAARSGVTAPAAADGDAGRTMVVQLIPFDLETSHTAAGTHAEPRISLTRLAEIVRPAGVEIAELVHAAVPSTQADDLSPGQGDAGAPPATRAMADLPSAEVIAFRARLQAHLARFRLYPAAAKDAGSQGVVYLHFVMARDGGVGDAWIEISSGVPAIDREALEAVRRAVPLPPLPASFPDTLDIRVPVSFKLS